MRNNTRGLIFHFLIVAIVFAISFVINLSESVRNLVYGNLIFKIVFVFLIVLLYYNFGKGLSKKNAKSLDFFAGNLIFLIGIILFAFAFLGMGMDFFDKPIGSSYWKFPVELFLMPQVYAIKVLGIDYNILSFLVSALIPGFIYGFSIKNSRNKMMRRKRQMRNRKNSPNRRV
ncbi:hypothetical protein [Peptoniphilus sp.]|jgi:F0F1-type ATP synthase assembly protein I|uniref:hypothetical protein n=1 Tax=Peptoniphilus sp. TaxID=1971214 RepID=UPI003D8F7CCF